MQHSHSVQSDSDVPAVILCIVAQDFEVIETGLWQVFFSAESDIALLAHDCLCL